MRRCISTFLSLAPVPVLSLDEMLARLDIEHGALPLFLVDPGPGPDQAIQSKQDNEAVTHFIASLSDRERIIVRRVFWEDETQTAIAAELGVSKMAVSKTLARVTKRAQAALSAYRQV